MAVSALTTQEALDLVTDCLDGDRAFLIVDRAPGVTAVDCFGLSVVPKKHADSLYVLDLMDEERRLALAGLSAESVDDDVSFLRRCLRVWFDGDRSAPDPKPGLGDGGSSSVPEVLQELFYRDARGESRPPKNARFDRDAVLEWRRELRALGPDMRSPIEDPWFVRAVLGGAGLGDSKSCWGRLGVFVPLSLAAVPERVAARVTELAVVRARGARRHVVEGSGQGGSSRLDVLIRAPEPFLPSVRRAVAAGLEYPIGTSGAVEVRVREVLGEAPEESTELSRALAQLSRLKFGRAITIVRPELADVFGKKSALLADDPVKGLIYEHPASCRSLTEDEQDTMAKNRLRLETPQPLIRLPEEWDSPDPAG